MNDQIAYFIYSLQNGGLYAVLALTLVVTFRSSGVLNFSTGALAALGVYEYAGLRNGHFLVPLPFLPKTVDVGGHLTAITAAIITIILCAIVGLILYLAVFRPIRGATPVGKAVASVGVMVVLNGLFALRFPTSPDPLTSSILPSGHFSVGSNIVQKGSLWFAASVVIITLLLVGAFRFTRFGLLTRAAAETEKGAFVSGIQPDRIAAANWLISGGVAGLAGVLTAPPLLNPHAPQDYTLFIVPALAAAVLGQFQFMVPAVVGGIVLGALQSETDLKLSWFWPAQGANYSAVALVFILVVLVVRAKPLPSRGVLTKNALGRAPRPVGLLVPTVFGAGLAIIGLFVLNDEWRGSLITSLTLAIVSLSLVVVTGYAGQVSLAQLALAGIAGFTLAKVTTSWSLPFPFSLIFAALVATVVGVVLGLPALRIRGLPVAIVTLVSAVTIQAVWFDNEQYVPLGGILPVKGLKLFGFDMQPIVGTHTARWQFGIAVLVILVLVCLAVAKLRTSSLGSQMLAVRANERSAAGAGIDVVRVKIIAFALASFIAGVGGAMIAYGQSFSGLNSSFYDAFLGLSVFTGVYLAGITSVLGGVVAGILAPGGISALLADKLIGISADWYQVLGGVGLIATVIGNPEGVVGPIHERIAKYRASKKPVLSETELPHEAHLEPMAPVPGGEVVLTAQNIFVRYGGVVAVDDSTLEAREGTIVGLIGPNGAGKTTLLDALSGFTRSSGQVRIGDRDLNGLSPFKRVRSGLGRTFQHTELYEDLTVTENIVVGNSAARGRSARSLQETLEVLDLTAVADRPVAELSQGRRQVVSIARALIGNPEVLLLDEPAGGLDSRESQWLGLRLRAIRDSGTTIVIIDHDMHLVLNLCDDIYVLNFGKIIAHGVPAAIRSDRTVAAAYLGSTHAEQEVAQ